jgi:hypothetical protein
VKNVMAVGGLLTALAALTACAGHGGAHPTVPQTPTPVAPSPPVASTPRPASSRPVGVAAPPAVAPGGSAPGRCAAPALNAALRAAGPAAGNRFAFLTLVNRSGTDCRVYGYVGLGLIGADGRALPTRVVRLTPPGPASVTLRPGASAYARLHWSVVPGTGEPEHGPCRPTPGQVWVTPPDERAHLTVPWSLGQVCGGGEISISPLAAGSGPG